ncbi:MAG: immunoglobulin domain-containing protein [Verrucomicrobiota bacterium]
MTLQPPPASTLLKAFLTVGLALVFSSGLQAVAPKAPVVTKVDFSLAGQDKGVVAVGTRHSYLVTWTDNSLDEEGFDVQVKAGTDPFVSFSQTSANTTQAALIGVTALAAGTDVIFQVVAWKYNGATIQSTPSKTFTFKVPADTAEPVLDPPSQLVVTNVDDSRMKFAWKDNSNSELFYQIDLKEASAASFDALTFVNHSGNNFIPLLPSTDHTFRLRLVPNTDYSFRVRATRINNLTATGSNASLYGNTVTLRSPVLSAPTDIGATTLSEKAIRLRWKDNSTNETGYKVEVKELGSTDAATSYGPFDENTTTLDVPVAQGSSLQYRAIAVYTYTPSGATSATTIESAPTDWLTYSTAFPAPTNLQASMTGRANTVDLTWEDNSGTEFGYNIYTRRQGTADWFFARATRENMTKVSVSSRTEATGSNGKPIFIPLEAGVVHEFVVRAVSQDEQNMSVDSNVASAQARHGFTSRLYHPAQVGFPLSRIDEGSMTAVPGYLASTSNATNRSEWSITNLPSGLFFNSGNGELTGTPTQAGLFNCTMTAEFTDSPTVTETLVLRVVPSNTAFATTPFVDRIIQPTTIGINTPFRVTLADKFKDPDAEIAVSLETSLLQVGQPRVIDIHLYPSLAPRAVENFLSYVNAGDYNNLIFHRLAWNRDELTGARVSPFVLQAGSLRAVANPRSFASVLSRPAPLNEPGIGNFRGTLSAAKLGARTSTATVTDTTGSKTVLKDSDFGYVGNPDSATTDFFVNLADNTGNLDNQNGGFTVFGRVSIPGMTVIDSISAMSEGSYQNNNTTSTYDATKDKRIIVDGGLTAFSGIPMTESPAPADMSISKTVRITKAGLTPTMRYSISNPSAAFVNAVVEGNELKLTGIKETAVGVPASVTVIAADLDGRSISQTVNVTVKNGYRAPVITKHPVSQAVVAGTKATFSVTATGTGLVYRWRHKVGSGLPVDVPNGSGPTYTIANVQAEHVGLYDVVVSNDTTILASTQARLDMRTAPTVGAIQSAKVVEVGKPLSLTVSNVVGAPAPTFAWKRGTTAVAGQTTATLNIPLAKLTDAGAYTATATNIVSKVTTNPVNVIVVNKATTRQFFTTGRTITLTAPVAGPGLTYHWRRNTAEIVNAPTFSGIDTNILKITGTATADTASYTCVITPPDNLGAFETGAIELFVVQRPSLPALLKDLDAPPTAFIGVDYSWKLPYSPLPSLTPMSFSVTGLPAGLKLNTTTGVISGRATQVGIFTIRATAYNVAGTSTPTSVGDLRVSPLPYSNIGSFVGTISPGQNLNKQKGGRFELTVQDTASYTAKVILGTETINTAGVLGIGTSLSGSGGITYQSRVDLKRKDKSIVTLLFELDPDLGYINGVVTNGTESGYISGFRQFWDAKWRPCEYSLYPANMSYNMSLNLNNQPDEGADNDVGNQNIPQGSGYLNMIVSPKGTATISGRLADGTTVTSSSMIGPQGEALLFLMLYTNTGSVLGQINIGDDLLGTSGALMRRVDGTMRWIKDVQPAAQRTYQAGIPETDLTVLGATYNAPGTNTIVMNLPKVTTPATVTNVKLDFSEGGLASASRNPDSEMRVSTANVVAYRAPNTANTFLSIVPSTGSVTGSFALLDGTTPAVPRSVLYQGLIIPPIPYTPAVTNSSGILTANEIAGSGGFATGYFLLPELTPTVTKSKIKSGRVLIQGLPITITSQPADQTVNEGADVSLNVSIAAGAQGDLITYRWRKDGNTYTGATTSNLNLSDVTQSHEGKYDCVISNGSYTVISDFAVVSVNDAVVNPTITRSPSAAKVASGTKITFTAAVERGTTPLTYQWKKGTTPITNATNSTYEITSATVGDSDSYTVVVSNVVSTNVASAANVLAVLDPAVIVNQGRTPADEVVPHNTDVTFSVTVSGTGPFTYQWKKGTVDITGATSSTYTLTSANSADAANYSVVVKNDVTPNGVTSAAIPLAVAAP